MEDPVLAMDGLTYEREAIEEWLKNRGTSPGHGGVLSSKVLVPNISVRQLIAVELESRGFASVADWRDAAMKSMKAGQKV